MDLLINLLIFVVVVAVLWWALNTVLAVLAVPSLVSTLAVVAFVVIVVLVIADYFLNRTWFWTRRM